MHNQAITFAGLGPVKASGQCDPGKSDRGCWSEGRPCPQDSPGRDSKVGAGPEHSLQLLE